MNHPPPFLGGQGRTADDIKDTGSTMCFWLLALVALLILRAFL